MPCQFLSYLRRIEKLVDSLPVVQPSPRARPSRLRTRVIHGYRVVLMVVIVLSIHNQHRWFNAQQRGAEGQAVEIEHVTDLFPDAKSLGEFDPDSGGQQVLDAASVPVGRVIQTSPEADDIVGFSGPTNTMIAIGLDDRVRGISVLRSGDTREHLQDVLKNESFMTSFNGLTRNQPIARNVDGVSGATLTSMAIAEGIARRLGGASSVSSRFPDTLTVAEAKVYFDSAASLAVDPDKQSLRRVLDAQGDLLGRVTRTAPHADNIVGYQGPTDLIIALDPVGRIVGVAVRKSYDNEPYVTYVRDDAYFFGLFKGLTLTELASLDIVEAEIEGVSGATATSVTLAEALIHTAREISREEAAQPLVKPWLSFATRDYGTIAVVLIAMLIAFTHLRGRHWLRIGLQIALVAYLGFINADMVSQALLVGWARNGVAWRVAPGLVLLTLAALACPLLTGRQVYCTHLCPFGALQDWLRRVPLKIKVPRRLSQVMRLVPAGLLLLVVAVAMAHLPLSLVGIEPFDAFVIRIAGAATLVVAAIGLVASTFVPMAYCHYGCPTGAMLGYIRIHGASGRFTRRDLFATMLAVLAVGVILMRG